MEVNIGRKVSSFPHCGRVFLCDDVLGITDLRLAHDAYRFALENGIEFVSESQQALNWGNWSSTGNQSGELVAFPVVGFTDSGSGNTFAGALHIDNPHFSAEALGELRGDCDGYALTLTFRMLTQAEYAQFNASSIVNPTGIGYRSQRIRVTIQNKAIQATSSTYVLLDIFADYAYYSANVSPLPALSNAVNTIDLETNNRGLDIGAINTVTIVGLLPTSVLLVQSCEASCFFRYELPKGENGGAWQGSPLVGGGNGVTPVFEPLVSPLTGMVTDGAGILATELHTFYTGLNRIPNGALLIGGNARAVTAFQSEIAQPLPSMGDLLSQGALSELRARATAALGMSWVSNSMMERNYGGAKKPIVGNAGIFQESFAGTNSMTTYVQCPQQATGYVLIAKVRTITAAGTHTVDFLLTNSDGNASQTIASTTQAGNSTGYRYLYVNGSLNLNMRPTSGKTERFTLRLRSTKSAPRSTTTNEPLDADGILSYYLAFY